MIALIGGTHRNGATVAILKMKWVLAMMSDAVPILP